jgi:hypothetical protein
MVSTAWLSFVTNSARNDIRKLKVVYGQRGATPRTTGLATAG